MRTHRKVIGGLLLAMTLISCGGDNNNAPARPGGGPSSPPATPNRPEVMAPSPSFPSRENALVTGQQADELYAAMESAGIRPSCRPGGCSLVVEEATCSGASQAPQCRFEVVTGSFANLSGPRARTTYELFRSLGAREDCTGGACKVEVRQVHCSRIIAAETVHECHVGIRTADRR